MDKFKQAARVAVNKIKPTQCECPLCKGTIFLRYNKFTDGIQSMCDSCGRYWIEGSEESAE